MSARLFVGGLAYEATEQDLSALFATIGKVIKVNVKRDRETGRSRGFAFVEMSNPVEADEARTQLNGALLLGRPIRIQVAEPRRGESDPFLPLVTPPMGVPLPPGLGAAATPPPSSAATVPVGSAPGAGDLPGKPARTRRAAATALAFTLALAAGVGLVRWHPWRAAGPLRILIVPEQSDVDARAIEAFAQALVVNLATAKELAVLPVSDGLRVARTAAEDQLQAAEGRGADRLLQLVVARRGGELELGLTLLDVHDNRVVWGVQRRGPETETWSLAAALAGQAAGALGVSGAPAYDYVTNLTGSAEMASSTLLGQAVGALRRGELDEAAQATAALSERFSTEAAAWALRCHALVLGWDARRTDATRRQLEACLAELDRRDGHNPYTEVYRGYVEAQEQRAAEAVARFDRVAARTDLSPMARAWVLRYRAVARQSTGNALAALADLQESLRLDPANAWTLGIFANALSQAGRFAEALPRAEQALALAPALWRSHQTLGIALLGLERWRDAAHAFGRACDLSAAQETCGLEAVSYLKAGEVDAARRAALAAEKVAVSGTGALNLACYWALSHEPKRALRWVKDALRLGVGAAQLEGDRDLESLRGLHEFEALLAGAGGR